MPHFEREANVTMSGMPTTAREFLAHMATHYKHLMSEFETVLWEAQVFSVYEDPQIVRALKAHMESGTSDANFMPKYGAIRARLEPVRGFQDIHQAVVSGSPYVAPKLDDPVLIEAIHQMGGWTKVCAEMPDLQAAPIEFDRYMRRFETVLVAARAKTQVQGHMPPALQGLGTPRIAAPAAARLQLSGPAEAAEQPSPAEGGEPITQDSLRRTLTKVRP
ncbi:Uncharacterised protein [Achromobacter sp. 2789STDY5608633]|uniref:hypothetical protein n=1 Tax=Pseudomonadota TaxID=1224 RepID=UPI0006C0ED6A|nr:hypothetical protein [Achromobacter sp. 2789STDY5608633]CUJ50658.1 Uncharacterised protein [Achromobacter sp. 2789STDY5608633]